MGRERDCRDYRTRTSADRETELLTAAAAVSDRLPGNHRVRIARFDATRGNPAVVRSVAGPAQPGNYVARAASHLQEISGALGFAASQRAEFIADDDYQTTSDGAVAVHFQQSYKGIPIFEATEVVRFDPAGAIQETVGSPVTIDRDLPAEPRLSVGEAAVLAARHVAVPDPDELGQVDSFGEPLPCTTVDVEGYGFDVVDSEDDACHTTVLEAGPFASPLRASLLWFADGADLRLTWEVLVALPGGEGRYRTLVDGETGEILYCRQLTHSAAARGNVYHVDGSEARQMTGFPRPLDDHGLPVPPDLPDGLPRDWVAVDRTEGNDVLAHLGATGPSLRGDVRNGVVTFDPIEAAGDDQKVLNIFYFNAVMHDFFYLLGFRELDGNFQRENFGHGGRGSDRVDARAHSGPVWGTANMATPDDGSSPRMNMGLVSSTGRHTAFDSTVVFHEFMHGVTNRLVGGPRNTRALEPLQSGGMGEGWGDYVACTINETDVVGSWVVARAGGIRGFPYDTSFPDHFGRIGTGRYDGVHNIGEIWCATLLDLNRRIGSVLAMQLVVDALKLSPANPSFLDMRDAILAALDNRVAAGRLTAAEHATAKNGAWAAFARFGMGPNAQSNGASVHGIVADFAVPVPDPVPEPDPTPDPAPGPDSSVIEVTPNLPIPDSRPAGVFSELVCPTAGAVSQLLVAVDIEHTYVGDLRVRLVSPGGTAVTLHDREGGSSDDIVRSWASEDGAPLSALVGEEAQGAWKLHVADFLGHFSGTLRKWSLDVATETESGVARGKATPSLSIPDNDLAGVTSSIAIGVPGVVEAVTARVDIRHTYIGDLRVALRSPGGTTVVLHGGTGGSTDDLTRTYTVEDRPALAAFAGENAEGLWVLEVSDRLGQDVGTLEEWSLDLALGDGPRTVEKKAEPRLAIPDNNPAGIHSKIVIDPTGTLDEVEVEVDITHTYIGDLRVTLTSPDGTPVVLHDGTGGTTNDLRRTYTPGDTPALADLQGRRGQGLWTLKVADLLGHDVGTLQSWSLKLTYA